MSEQNEVNVFDMPDDAFLEVPESEYFTEGEDTEGSTEESTEGEESSDEELNQEDQETDSDDEFDDSDEETFDTDESDSDEEEDSEEDDSDSDEDSEDGDTEDSSPDVEDFYSRVTGEFKANGKPMRVDNPDDVIRLMQMGANYNQKMAALKPNLKALKMLEKADLLDEEKLNFLIDVSQGNQGALAKLMSNKKVDPMDLALGDDINYEASNHKIGDQELALDEVIDSIQDTETYSDTIRVVTQEWDDSSKQAVADQPELLKAINDHMACGIYNMISTEVSKQRVLGRLNGVSDIEAYQQVGDAIHAKGGFNSLLSSQQQEQQNPTEQNKASTDTGSSQRRKKRRAVSSTKRTGSRTSQDSDFNPLDMSDEEFLKQFDSKFL